MPFVEILTSELDPQKQLTKTFKPESLILAQQFSENVLKINTVGVSATANKGCPLLGHY